MGEDTAPTTSGEDASKHTAGHHGRGGSRIGAGRPKLHDQCVRITISLPASYWGALVRVGNGNTSAAVRRLIEDAGIVW